jgi:hypothetical protein
MDDCNFDFSSLPINPYVNSTSMNSLDLDSKILSSKRESDSNTHFVLLNKDYVDSFTHAGFKKCSQASPNLLTSSSNPMSSSSLTSLNSTTSSSVTSLNSMTSSSNSLNLNLTSNDFFREQISPFSLESAPVNDCLVSAPKIASISMRPKKMPKMKNKCQNKNYSKKQSHFNYKTKHSEYEHQEKKDYTQYLEIKCQQLEQLLFYSSENKDHAIKNINMNNFIFVKLQHENKQLKIENATLKESIAGLQN